MDFAGKLKRRDGKCYVRGVYQPEGDKRSKRRDGGEHSRNHHHLTMTEGEMNEKCLERSSKESLRE